MDPRARVMIIKHTAATPFLTRYKHNTLATAPLVDALKIKTSANLSWEPNTDNIGE